MRRSGAEVPELGDTHVEVSGVEQDMPRRNSNTQHLFLPDLMPSSPTSKGSGASSEKSVHVEHALL